MSKLFVIPDVHLKPWIFDKAEELISCAKYDAIVCPNLKRVFRLNG